MIEKYDAYLWERYYVSKATPLCSVHVFVLIQSVKNKKFSIIQRFCIRCTYCKGNFIFSINGRDVAHRKTEI